MSQPKASKKDKTGISLRDVQLDREETDRCRESPSYFYNTYIRKEGQKVLSEEEYLEYVKTIEAIRSKQKDTNRFEYPLKPEDASISRD